MPLKSSCSVCRALKFVEPVRRVAQDEIGGEEQPGGQGVAGVGLKEPAQELGDIRRLAGDVQLRDEFEGLGLEVGLVQNLDLFAGGRVLHDGFGAHACNVEGRELQAFVEQILQRLAGRLFAIVVEGREKTVEVAHGQGTVPQEIGAVVLEVAQNVFKGQARKFAVQPFGHDAEVIVVHARPFLL